MISLPLLKQEILDDPTGLGYAEPLAVGNHERIAGLLNTSNIAGKVPVTAKAVRRVMILTGVMGALRSIAWNGILPDNTPASFNLVALCHTTIAALEPGAFDDFDMTDSTVRTGIETLVSTMVTAGVMSQAQADAVLNLSNGFVSRKGALFGINERAITPSDVANALRM